MKKLFVLAIAGCVTIGTISMADAAKRKPLVIPVKKQDIQDPVLEPIPEVQMPPITPNGAHPAPVVSYTPMQAACPGVVSCTRVKYKDHHQKSPCGVTRIIQVKDPCWDGCGCQKCVAVEICVPTCACERVRATRRGNRIRYDYGKYMVDVRIKRGFVEVDYQCRRWVRG